MKCILVYDISKDVNGAKRARHVFKLAKKYLTHIQNSVFEGDLTEAQYKIFSDLLKKELHFQLDCCIMFSISNNAWINKQFLTELNDDTSNFI